MGRFDFKTRTGQISAIIQTNAGTSIDADAQAYFDRVTAAGGTLSQTEKDAVNTLTLSLKSAGVWTKMIAIYPMVGTSAAACSQNLKSSSFTGSFSSGWTFASTGVTPNGTSAFMNTGINPFTSLTNNNYSLTHYSRTQKTSGTEVELGSINPFSAVMISLSQYYNGKAFVAGDYNSSLILNTASTNTLGFQVNTRTTQTSAKMFFNNVQIGSTLTLSNPNALPSSNLSVGSNSNGSAFEFSSKECAFASIGDGLSDTNASDLYAAVQAFQTTLSRQV